MPTAHHGRIAARRALLDLVHSIAETLRAAGAAACSAGAATSASVSLRDIDVYGTELHYAHYPIGADPAPSLQWSEYVFDDGKNTCVR